MKNTLDLAGIWQLNMEALPGDTPPERFPDRIRLPGTTSLAGLGKENPGREAGCLTEMHPFAGKAWYRRAFSCDREGPALLTLERTRPSGAWLDGRYLGTRDSLCTPHRYPIPFLGAGTHELVLAVDNTALPIPGGHMTSRDTQTNWNGITGEISLSFGEVFPVSVRIVPEGDGLRFRCGFLGTPGPGARFSLSVDGMPGPGPLPCGAEGIDCVVPLSAPLAPWDEYSPALHCLRLCLGEAEFCWTFGVRALAAEGRRLLINGRPLFLRGKHDALVFPQTGFAPTDESAWLRYLRTVRRWGLNHLRFHTCCPPEAAFRAADALGMYLEPELPFWGTLHAPGEEGFDEKADRYLFREGQRILAEFGHHPSLILFSLGNELWGSRERMGQWIRAYRAEQDHILYTAGSNSFQFVPAPLPEEDVFVGVRFSRTRLFRGSYAMCDAPQGRVQTTAPESVSDYDREIREADGTMEEGCEMQIQYGTGVKTVTAEGGGDGQRVLPVISHEIGQYAFYPRLEEGSGYTGPLKPLYLDLYRERLRKAGLYPERHRFFAAAGKLACACWRREIETALRTDALSGFQLLDLQDYPGQGVAPVGVLDALMNEKGLITAGEWRAFCSDTVILARLERFVLPSGSPLRFGLQVSECRPGRTLHRVSWRLSGPEGTLCEGAETLRRQAGERLGPVLWIVTPPLAVPKSGEYTLSLSLEEGIRTAYPLWILEKPPVRIGPEGIRVPEGEVRFLRAGEKRPEGPCLRFPDPEGKEKSEYASDFWSYRMFSAISRSMGKKEPAGTLGLCVDPSDPLLARFPTRDHTTPLWYTLLAHAHCEPVSCTDLPVQMIDTPERARRLGILYRKEGEVFLTSRLWEAPEDPAVQCFACSLARALLARP